MANDFIKNYFRLLAASLLVASAPHAQETQNEQQLLGVICEPLVKVLQQDLNALRMEKIELHNQDQKVTERSNVLVQETCNQAELESLQTRFRSYRAGFKRLHENNAKLSKELEKAKTDLEAEKQRNAQLKRQIETLNDRLKAHAEAKQLSPKQKTYSLGHGAIPVCDEKYNGKCIGTKAFSNGKYVGFLNAGIRQGPGYQEYNGGDIYLGVFKNGNRRGASLYTWKSGSALFVDNWQQGQTYTSNSNASKVFPYLANRFKSLPLAERKKLQASLFNKGFYDAKIDGVWGKNTLIAFAKFSLFYLQSVDLRRHENVEAVLDGTYTQMIGTHVVPAPKEVVKLISRATRANNKGKSSFELEGEYKSLNNTTRKQVQWVLKQLGFYEAAIDGTWGPKTMQAMYKYINSYGFYEAQHVTVYSSILSEMPVPASFDRPQNTSHQKNANEAETNLLKLLIVGGLCSATSNPSACLAGAADTISGNSSNNTSQQSYNRSPSKNYLANSQCRSDTDCAAGSQCVRRLGKSMCLKLVDNSGTRTPMVNAEPKECRSNSDCPSTFSCDRQLRVCLKR